MRPVDHGPFVKALLAHGGRAWVRIEGVSMKPLLVPGDHVMVEPPCGMLSRGDVVVLAGPQAHPGRPAPLLTHRVHRVEATNGGRWLRTKGDCTWGWDSPVPEAAIIGRVTAIRHGERVTSCAGRRWRVITWGLLWWSMIRGWVAWVWHRLRST